MEAVQMRRATSTTGFALAVVGAVLIAGCGAHGDASPPSPTVSSANPAEASPSAFTGTLKVAGVSPHKLTGTSPIVVHFADALEPNSPLPTLRPYVGGRWVRQGSSAVFTPTGAYPPDSTIKVRLTKRPGAPVKTIAIRKTPRGSLRRAEQILAQLGYLPLTTTAATPAGTAAKQQAVYQPPQGRFVWRYPHTPKSLKQNWNTQDGGTVLRGAVIAFQHQSNLPLDGSIGRKTWHALIQADITNKVDPDRYSYVSADLYLPQRLTVWVAGHTAITSPVNGGVSGAPTPLGTFPVYLRYTSTTMSGTNPDGSHYRDPGIPWVNYFTGGSAVHGFPRASYGFPQSVGCLELPIPTAAQVYKLINYGTLVNVFGPYVAPPPVATPAPPKPSHSPTPKPTPTPTRTPAPTHHPSPHPTHAPTHHPTPHPTHHPSPHPTHTSPSPKPTHS
jgi:peptidoglycan hydrolase-like protein with peptidoglycan-binding domain